MAQERVKLPSTLEVDMLRRAVAVAIVVPFLLVAAPAHASDYPDKGNISGSVTYMFGPETMVELDLKPKELVEDLGMKESSPGVRHGYVADGDRLGMRTEFENLPIDKSDVHYIPALWVMDDLGVGAFRLVEQRYGDFLMDVDTEIDLTDRPGDSAEVTITFPGEVESDTGEVDGNTVTWKVDGGERVSLTAVAASTQGHSVSQAKDDHESWTNPVNSTLRDVKDTVTHPYALALYGPFVIVGVGALIGFMYWLSKRRAGRPRV